MLAVFLSKSTLASVTPGTLSSAFLTVIGQTGQVIFFTSRVTVCKVPANRLKGNATRAPSRTRRFLSDFIINNILENQSTLRTVVWSHIRKLEIIGYRHTHLPKLSFC